MDDEPKRTGDTLPTEPLSGSRDSPGEIGLCPGDTFAECELLEELGRGGMGAVFKARNLALGRIVALKVLLPVHRELEDNITRFLAEARTLARLEHHNCVTIYRVGRCDGLDFIEMQYVEGPSAAELVEQGPLEPRHACRIIEQVARALDYAHRHGIIHRDIKPANILLAEDGPVKLVDFGLAKKVERGAPALTAPGLMLGTPLYMAPEQWKEEPVSPGTDLYSLGATFFHLLTGKPPFEGSLHELMKRHLEVVPPAPSLIRPEVPEKLAALVGRLLAKDPADRYPDAASLVEDLRAWEHAPAARPGQPSPAQPRTSEPERSAGPEPGGIPQRGGPSRRVCVLVGLTVGLVVLAAHGLGWLEGLELWSLDRRFAWSPGAGGSSPVATIVIDQESKDLLAAGQPLSREQHLAALLARLGDAGAEAIGMDLLLLDRSTTTEDGSLAAMTRLVPGVVHAVNVAPGPSTSRSPTRDEIPREWALPIPASAVPAAGHFELPVPEVAAATSRVGHVTLEVDRDGAIRRVPLLLAYAGRVYPSLSLATVLEVLGAGPGSVRLLEGRAIVVEAPDGRSIRIPVDDRARMRVNFRWEERALESHPLWSVLGGPGGDTERTSREELAARVILVGSSLAGDYDVGIVPGSPVCPLVWVHAMAVDTILDESFILPVGSLATVVIVIGCCLLVAMGVTLLRPSWATALASAVILLYVGLSLWLFSGHDRVLVPMAAPILGMCGVYLITLLLRYVHEEREKRLVSAALSRYLSPAVTREVLRDPGALHPGGKRKELTFLSVSLHGFQEISEQLEPEEVDEVLGLFFAEMTDTVFEFEGTVHRLSGQGLQAFFGEPVPQPDHATRGVRCGIETLHRARSLLARWSHSSRPKLQVGVGVHTGYATVGNVGSLQRMEYTVIGRPVDLTEDLARQASEGILVSARTASLVGDGLVFERRDKRAGVECFEPRLRVGA